MQTDKRQAVTSRSRKKGVFGQTLNNATAEIVDIYEKLLLYYENELNVHVSYLVPIKTCFLYFRCAAKHQEILSIE
jgi:hypothetical protein